MLDAAYRLFLERGYAATSIRAVAQEAEVSDQTVYAVFADKPSLLVEVGRDVISGYLSQDAAPIRDFETEIRTVADPGDRIALAAAWNRSVWERGMLRFESMLLDAAATDPRASEVAAAVWKRKYDENKELFAVAFPEETRRPSDDFDDLYDIFFALDSAAFVRILIDDRGWTFDQYEGWLRAIMRRLFSRLGDEASPSGL
jgi:AcrR family transcriptional regulator